MKKSNSFTCDCGQTHQYYFNRHASNGQAVYGLGVIGALVYYIATATGFWIGVLGILKAFVWPAFVVYELLKFLHM